MKNLPGPNKLEIVPMKGGNNIFHLSTDVKENSYQDVGSDIAVYIFGTLVAGLSTSVSFRREPIRQQATVSKGGEGAGRH